MALNLNFIRTGEEFEKHLKYEILPLLFLVLSVKLLTVA